MYVLLLLTCASIAIVNLFGPVMMEKSGRRLLFVYGNGVQAAILLALGALYYSTSNAGAWALGILYNLGERLSTESVTFA